MRRVIVRLLRRPREMCAVPGAADDRIGDAACAIRHCDTSGAAIASQIANTPSQAVR